jgi:hypothetical protein
VNTRTCPKYSCKVLVETALYFELQEKTKIVASVDYDFCQQLVFFLYSSKYNILFSEFFTVPLVCLYVCPHLISDFLQP